MRPDDLLRIAAGLAESGAGRPRRTDLCRATSTAYYALFHCLAKTCADMLAGRSPAKRRQPAWRQAYRALDHGEAKKRCERNRAMQRFPAGIRDFAETFASLQSKRHMADYDPDASFRKSDVVEDIDATRNVIARLAKTPIEQRRAFAIYLLTKLRI